jgi:type I restriction enzyme, R subunit
MSEVGQRERVTQDRVVQLFKNDLGYRYLGNLHDLNNKNIREQDLKAWLKKRGISGVLIQKAFRQIDAASALGEGRKLYYANKDVYRLLRYGVKDKEGAGEQNQTIWLIDWQNPEANDFAVAEEVSVQGEYKKRPDVVLYVNGIALGVIESL